MLFGASLAASALSAYGRHGARINRAERWSAVILLALLVAPRPVAGGATPIRLLVLGDSLMAGYGLAWAQAFPAQIERALAAEGLAVRVSSAGVSGDTTAGGRARLAWTLGASAQDQPDAAIVELGANDALRGIEPEATAQNLDAILTELNRCGIPVLLAGMRAPPNLGPEYGRRFDAIFPRLAQAHGVALYPFFLEGVAAVPRLNQDDGIHPNAEGIAEIVRRITPAAAALVRGARARAQAP
jgi:acyl-CoA thioesterase-1